MWFCTVIFGCPIHIPYPMDTTRAPFLPILAIAPTSIVILICSVSSNWIHCYDARSLAHIRSSRELDEVSIPSFVSLDNVSAFPAFFLCSSSYHFLLSNAGNIFVMSYFLSMTNRRKWAKAGFPASMKQYPTFAGTDDISCCESWELLLFLASVELDEGKSKKSRVEFSKFSYFLLVHVVWH